MELPAAVLLAGASFRDRPFRRCVRLDLTLPPEVMTATRLEPTAIAAPATEQAPAWHCLPTAEVAARLATDVAAGLTRAEATSRLARYGPNAIKEGEKRSAWRMFFGQFTDFMIVLLIVAAVISGFIGELEDAIAILAIVVLNAVIGFVQEYRAEKAIAGAEAARGAQGARDPRRHDERHGAGRRAGAGRHRAARSREASSRPTCASPKRAAQVEEAALTGESHPVEKQTEPLPRPTCALGDRINMALQRHDRHLRPRPRASSSAPAWRPSSARSRRCSHDRGSAHAAAEAPRQVRQAARRSSPSRICVARVRARACCAASRWCSCSSPR